jgi:BlaI family transcriptional regulator, penicillinase repressor
MPISSGVDRQQEYHVVKKPQNVTDAELAVLKVLWRNGPSTAKAITDAVYPHAAESEFASVHSFLLRLERKGFVTRDRSTHPHLFSATISEADIIGRELSTLAERLGERSIAPLIMQLVTNQQLSRKDLAEIRKLLNDHTR